MYSKEEIAKKIVEFLMKKSVKNLDRNRKILGLLKFLKLAKDQIHSLKEALPKLKEFKF